MHDSTASVTRQCTHGQHGRGVRHLSDLPTRRLSSCRRRSAPFGTSAKSQARCAAVVREIQAHASWQGADFLIVHEIGSLQPCVLAVVGRGQREPRTIDSWFRVTNLRMRSVLRRTKVMPPKAERKPRSFMKTCHSSGAAMRSAQRCRDAQRLAGARARQHTSGVAKHFWWTWMSHLSKVAHLMIYVQILCAPHVRNKVFVSSQV